MNLDSFTFLPSFTSGATHKYWSIFTFFPFLLETQCRRGDSENLSSDARDAGPALRQVLRDFDILEYATFSGGVFAYPLGHGSNTRFQGSLAALSKYFLCA